PARPGPARPGPARSVPDARAIDDDLAERGIALSFGGRSTTLPTSWAKCLQYPGHLADFEVELLRMRTCEDMAVARAKDKLRGKQPDTSNG
ncbi:hypothetical protein SAMN04487819_1383, partial [Actinopolyspora alba]